MRINEKIKTELQNLLKKGVISDLQTDEKLNNIKFTNSSGTWEFKENKIDICDCNEKTDYMVIFNGFTQIFECKNCLLFALQNYDKCGFEDDKI